MTSNWSGLSSRLRRISASASGKRRCDSSSRALLFSACRRWSSVSASSSACAHCASAASTSLRRSCRWPRFSRAGAKRGCTCSACRYAASASGSRPSADSSVPQLKQATWRTGEADAAIQRPYRSAAAAAWPAACNAAARSISAVRLSSVSGSVAAAVTESMRLLQGEDQPMLGTAPAACRRRKGRFPPLICRYSGPAPRLTTRSPSAATARSAGRRTPAPASRPAAR